MRTIFLAFIVFSFVIAPSAFANPSEVAPADSTPQVVKVGDTFSGYTLEDAHGVKHSLKPETKLVLMSFNMELSKGIHKWLSEKDADFLGKNKTEYVVDITEMPGIITWMFARPKMKKYPFQILLADDEDFAPKYPKEEAKISAIELGTDSKVQKISFFTDMDAVDKAYFQPMEEAKNVKILSEQQMMPPAANNVPAEKVTSEKIAAENAVEKKETQKSLR